MADTTGGNKEKVPKPPIRGRGGRGGRGGPRGSPAIATASRFKPKNVRRSATELAEIALKEDVRKAAVMAELARQQARLARVTVRQRGRGDTMGRGRGRINTASSIFGIAPEGLKKASGMMSLGSGASSGSGGGGTTARISVKNERSDHSSLRNQGATGRGGTSSFTPQYPGEDEDAIRIDIENINLISDDEADFESKIISKVSDKGKAAVKGGLRPVRLHREEHKERGTIVNTASKTKDKTSSDYDEDTGEGLFVSDGTRPSRFKRETENLATEIKNREDSSDPQIKLEPSLDDNSDPVLLSAAITESSKLQTRSLPESKGSRAEKVELGLDTRTPRQISKKGKKFVIQSEEDRAEYERHLGDIEILVNELGSLQQNTSSKTQDTDGNESKENTEAVQEEHDKKDGRLYLFQFPPVLPALFNPLIEEKTDSSIKIKTEISEPSQDQDFLGKNSKGKDKVVVDDLSASASAVKLEVEDDSHINQKEDISDRTELVHEEGFIGKLVVRESGRVELCWGGTKLLLARGVDAGFLTTGVIVDGVERGPVGGGEPEGKALGMGQIMGKFVVVPDWMSMA